MSSNTPKDSGLYSMQDVKMGAKGGSAANVRPVQQKSKGGWASDEDAGSLLAGILDETESAAKEEERRRQRELDAKEQQRKEQEAAEAARKRAEADRLLREEAERAAQSKHRRTGMLEAIHGPTPEEIERRKRVEEDRRKEEETQRKLAEAERARVAAEQRAATQAREAKIAEQQRLEALANQATVAPVKKSNTGLIIGAVAAVLLVAVTAVAALLILNGKEDPNANLAFAKTTLDAQGFMTASVEKDFQGIYKAPPVEEEPAAVKGKTTPRRNTAGKGNTGNAGNAGKGKEKGNKFGKDVFGGGGIVF